MSNNPEAKLTIVVPVRNRRDQVLATLDSIAEQTYRPLKLVLVDNGSTDGTLQALEGWAKARRSNDFAVKVTSEEAPGAAAARNAGLALVDTEWTMFFDSDDAMLPGHVARAMRCVAEKPDAELVGWDVHLVGDDGKVARKPFAESDLLFRNIFNGCMATLRYMARTEAFRRAGGWDASARYWDDIELGHRLLMLQPPLSIYKAKGWPTVRVQVQADSITGEAYSIRADRAIHALDLIEAACPADMKWMPRLKRAILAGLCAKEGDTAAAEMAMESISEPSAWRRRVYRMAYKYQKAGGRGTARIFRNLL